MNITPLKSIAVIYSEEEIIKRGKELAEEYGDCFWRVLDKRTNIIFQWNDELGYYTEQFEENCN